MKSRRGKLAFVIQRYGLEVNGGSEMLCRRLAEKLRKYHDVEILTTCAIDHATWKNEYPAGTQTINDVPVRRFPVSAQRNDRRFGELSDKLFVLQEMDCREDGVEWMRQLGPYSQELFRFIEDNKNSYDLFVFFTYLFATTYFGLSLVKEKAVFIPTAHDEAYIRLPIFNEVFKGPRGFFFLCPEEMAFVHRLFQNQDVPHVVTGMGIEIPAYVPPPEVFRKKFNQDKPYILYVGRIEEGKGCKQLIEFFINYRTRDRRDLQLLLLGKSLIDIPSHPDIRHLGFVSEEDKFSAISGAEVLINSSFYESFSIVLMEAWIMGVPALVNGKCNVLAGQCKRSNGGLWYHNADEFKACLDWLLDHPTLAKQIGQSGQAHVKNNYSWGVMERKYLSLLDKLL